VLWIYMFVKSLFHYAAWSGIQILLFVFNEIRTSQIGNTLRDAYRNNQVVPTEFFRGFQQNTWGIFFNQIPSTILPYLV
jgi:hypothetical protein